MFGRTHRVPLLHDSTSPNSLSTRFECRCAMSETLKRLQDNGASPFFHVLEITCEIFRYSVPPLHPLSVFSSYRSSLPWPSIKQAPLSISHVCRYWREVAISTPALWERISLLDCTESRVNAATEWSSRSQSLPLEVQIRNYDDDLLRDFVLSGAHRWRSFVAVFFEKQSGRYRSIFQGLSGGAPFLKTLSITVHHLPLDEPVILDIRLTPLLKNLRITGSGTINLIAPKSVHELQDIALMRRNSWDELRDLVSSLPFLKSMMLLVQPDFAGREVNPPMKLQKLRSLSISIAPVHVRFDFMASLLLPGLEELHMNVPTWFPSDSDMKANHADCLQSLLHRSKPPLTKLSLDGLKLHGASAFLSLFQGLDVLQSLAMDGDQMSDELFGFLSSRAEGKDVHVLLPLLRGLRLTEYSPDAPDSLRKFILSRHWANTDDEDEESVRSRPTVHLRAIILVYISPEHIPAPIKALKGDADVRKCIGSGMYLHVT